MLERSLVSVVTPALAKAVVPVATVRSELGFGSDTSQDVKIGRLIAALSREFAGINGRRQPLLRQTYLERTRLHDNLDEWNGNVLGLTRWPIESVVSVTDAGTPPVTVDASQYSIALEQKSGLYRPIGWSTCWDYLATFIAGWIPPGSGPGLVIPWGATAAKVAGAWVKPLAAENGSNPLLYECTAAGTTHATAEPTWPTTAGLTVADGTVTWTARAASELPEDIQEAAIVTAVQWFGGGLDTPAGVSAESDGGHSISYATDRAGLALPPYATSVLQGYR